MAEIWGAAIAVAGAVGGAAMQADAAGDASRASARGSAQSIAEQRRQFDLTRQDTATARTVGNQALNALGRIYGYGTGVPAVGNTTAPPAPGNALAPRPNGVDPSSGFRVGVGGSIRQAIPGGSGSGPVTIDNATGQVIDPATSGPATGVQPGAGGGTALGPAMPAGADYSNFFASPDYQFRRQQGTQGIERTASARGLTGSGNALVALDEYNSNLAAGEFGNYFNRQAALAGIGQSATNTATTAGMNMANNNSQSLQDAANARASGISDSANAWGNALGTIGGIAYDRWGRPKKPAGGV